MKKAARVLIVSSLCLVWALLHIASAGVSDGTLGVKLMNLNGTPVTQAEVFAVSDNDSVPLLYVEVDDDGGYYVNSSQTLPFGIYDLRGESRIQKTRHYCFHI